MTTGPAGALRGTLSVRPSVRPSAPPPAAAAAAASASAHDGPRPVFRLAHMSLRRLRPALLSSSLGEGRRQIFVPLLFYGGALLRGIKSLWAPLTEICNERSASCEKQGYSPCRFTRSAYVARHYAPAAAIITYYLIGGSFKNV